MDESRNEVEQRLAEVVERRVTEGVTSGITVLLTVAVAFVITVVVLKFVWAWTITDLFPGAVAEGLINANLTWLAAVKFAVLVAVVTGVNRTLTDAIHRR